MVELLSPGEMNTADRLTIAGGVSGFALMSAAGNAVAVAVSRHCAPGALVKILAGPGNNGGDGYVAARLLADSGYDVEVLRFGQPPGQGDAARAAAEWRGKTVEATAASIAGSDVVVDALFGAGLARPIEGRAYELVDAINRWGGPVVAIDLPSGVSGATGQVMGIAVRATETVTFFRKKPGHVLLPGRLYCGKVEVTQIGIPDGVLERIGPQTFLNQPDLWRAHYPTPLVTGHKYTRGHAVVVSGGLASTGAARLAARGALRIGAGLVTIAAPSAAVPVVAADSLAVMVREVDGPQALGRMLQDARLNAVVLGPGGGIGGAMRQSIETALDGEQGVVLDADALTSFAGAAADLRAAIAKHLARPCVLTPHDGEFSRLFKDVPEVDATASKLARARAAAKYLGGTIVLKGADTVVAAPDGRAAIADNAPPWLATAGSGDVLAGMIGGLLAQGTPAFDAAAAAVWLHGEAANAFGPGLISEDIPDTLPRVLRRMFNATA